MNKPILPSHLQATVNKIKNNQKCRFTDIDQLHKTVSSQQALRQQLDGKTQKMTAEYKPICADIDKIRRSSLSGMALPHFITAVNFIFSHLQENEFSLLTTITKPHWVVIVGGLDDMQKNRKLDYPKTKLLAKFHDTVKSKGLNCGVLAIKLGQCSKYNQMLKKFESDNASLTSKEIEELYKYITSNNLLGGISSKASTGFANYKKAADAYNKTLNGLTAPLQQALKNMVDSNNNNATVFQILMIDKIVTNLKDFPANKRNNFLVERDRLMREMTGYDAEYTAKSTKLFDEEVFATIALSVKQIAEKGKGIVSLEELMADVIITSNILGFRTHKGLKEAPYLHQGNDFNSWGHEGILHCPKTFPTKNGDMLEADEIFVLDVVRNTNPLNNYITIAMVNHQKGIIFSTYHHVYHISVKEKQKIKPGDVLGNYWKYIKNPSTNDAKLIGYAKPTDKPNRFTGASLDYLLSTQALPTRNDDPFESVRNDLSFKGYFPIYHFSNGGKFPYFIKKQGSIYYMLDTGGGKKIETKDITNMKLKLKNEHFHVERRFVDKATYLKDYFPAKSNASLKNVTLSQSNLTKHFSEHAQIKKLALNSSFGNLITASALLDTKSKDSKIFLEELKKLRANIKSTPYFRKNHGALTAKQLETEIKELKIDAPVRDYTMLLIFEKIVKLGCELQKYTNKTDNCKLSELQAKITDAKQLLVNKKF